MEQSMEMNVAPPATIIMFMREEEVMRLERHNGVLVVTITPELNEAARLFWEVVLQLAPPNTALVVSPFGAK